FHTLNCAGYAFGGGGSGAAVSDGGTVIVPSAIISPKFRALLTSSSLPAENTTEHDANARQQLACTGTSHGGGSLPLSDSDGTDTLDDMECVIELSWSAVAAPAVS
ncbi:MAG: hypothetical protein ABI852_13205, partial [Gemmatimonadaceae bacterium]